MVSSLFAAICKIEIESDIYLSAVALHQDFHCVWSHMESGASWNNSGTFTITRVSAFIHLKILFDFISHLEVEFLNYISDWLE